MSIHFSLRRAAASSLIAAAASPSMAADPITLQEAQHIAVSRSQQQLPQDARQAGYRRSGLMAFAQYLCLQVGGMTPPGDLLGAFHDVQLNFLVDTIVTAYRGKFKKGLAGRLHCN